MVNKKQNEKPSENEANEKSMVVVNPIDMMISNFKETALIAEKNTDSRVEAILVNTISSQAKRLEALATNVSNFQSRILSQLAEPNTAKYCDKVFVLTDFISKRTTYDGMNGLALTPRKSLNFALSTLHWVESDIEVNKKDKATGAITKVPQHRRTIQKSVPVIYTLEQLIAELVINFPTSPFLAGFLAVKDELPKEIRKFLIRYVRAQSEQFEFECKEEEETGNLISQLVREANQPNVMKQKAKREREDRAAAKALAEKAKEEAKKLVEANSDKPEKSDL